MDILTYGVPLWAILLWAIFMALVQALPRPSETDGKPYVIFYQFLHGLSINVKLLFDPIGKKKSEGATLSGI